MTTNQGGVLGTTGAADVGALSVLDGASVGALKVGALSVGALSVDAAIVVAASVGAVGIGAASVGARAEALYNTIILRVHGARCETDRRV